VVQAGGLQTAVRELPVTTTRGESGGRRTRSETSNREADQAKDKRQEVRSEMQEGREARGAVKRAVEKRTR
jgi:hypothetical protein